MEIAKIEIGKTTGVCTSRRRIPAGIVGATVSVVFKDPVWDDLTKTVVFRGKVSRVAEFDGTVAVIPGDIVSGPGVGLHFGIWGQNSKTGLQLPLIEIPIGITEKATDPQADPSVDPGLPIWAQLQQDIEELKNAGVGKPGEKGEQGDPGEDGGWYTPAVTRPDKNTIEFAFTPSKDGMPAVEPGLVELPDSGENIEEHNTDPYSHADIRKRLSAANIVESASGDVIAVSDSSDMELTGLRICGKTTQDGTPTPEAPVPLESVGDDGSILVTVGTSNMDENPQKMTVSTPNGLPGIPVTSGGNYTDVNGQQWICDEVDFTKGVYTQRIGVYTLDKTKTWTWNTMHSCSYAYVPGGKITDSVSQHERYVSSNRYIGTSWVRVGYTDAEYHCAFIYGISQVGFYDKDCTNVSEFLTKLGDNSIEVQYVLENPVETAISAEELAQYSNANLRTYYPSTTIFNDAGAGMEVKYIADTNLYIDKKFAELSTALLNQ